MQSNASFSNFLLREFLEFIQDLDEKKRKQAESILTDYLFWRQFICSTGSRSFYEPSDGLWHRGKHCEDTYQDLRQ